MYTLAQQASYAKEDASPADAQKRICKLFQLQSIRELDKDIATLIGIPLTTRFVSGLISIFASILLIAFQLLRSKLGNIDVEMF